MKTAFYPLANKSYESMAKMKKLQPEMERLKEKYKDDKMGMQKELMQVYQKEKINPMAGCSARGAADPGVLLPLQGAVRHHRHAPCAILRLDPRSIGTRSDQHLQSVRVSSRMQMPEMLHLGIWPLIMGVTMWVQMQLNPKQPDPTQQMIFNWMPVMFTFMLGSFPAGLVIYWAWNNLLSITQQSIIMKRNGVKVPLLENIGLDKYVNGGKAKSGVPAASPKPVDKPKA